MKKIFILNFLLIAGNSFAFADEANHEEAALRSSLVGASRHLYHNAKLYVVGGAAVGVCIIARRWGKITWVTKSFHRQSMTEVGDRLSSGIVNSEKRIKLHIESAIKASEQRVKAHTSSEIKSSEQRIIARLDQMEQNSRVRHDDVKSIAVIAWSGLKTRLRSRIY
jgi:hypothetical protein